MTDFGGAALGVGRKYSRAFLAASASLAISLAAVAPAYAAGGYGSAEKLRKLDIMLMVTSLRCRTTADNFQAEYQDFTTNHIAELNQAATEMREDLVGEYGNTGSARMLDRMSTVMANAYGQGHPWLSCHELKQVTANLAEVHGRETLVEAADQLLGDGRSVEFAYARR